MPPTRNTRSRQSSVRWGLFFIVLAAFNLLTVCFSLILNHQLINVQQHTVEGNQTWVERLKLCDQLAEKAAAIATPANRVLQSRHTRPEEARSTSSAADFDRLLAELQHQLPVDLPPAVLSHLQKQLQEVQTQEAELVACTHTIFAAAHEENWPQVANTLVALSKEFDDVLRSLDDTRIDFRTCRSVFLQKQLQTARQLGRSEWLLGGLILLMLLGAVVYGFNMQRQMSRIEAERLRAELLLHESEIKYRILFEDSRDAIMTLEPPHWRFTAGNRATIEMFRAKGAAEFIAYEPWRLSPEYQPDGRPSSEKAREMIQHAVREGNNFFEWTHKRITGETFPATVLLSRLMLNDKVFLQATVRDVSERMQAEAEREAMRAQLVQAQKLESIGTLASGVAHEINNPINGIMNYTQLLMDRLEPGPLQDFAGRIMRETGRVASIVRNLLSFARPEALTVTAARVPELVRDVLSLVQTLMRNDQITLEVAIPDDLPILHCRHQQIQQVLMNLLVNARDALNEKYPGPNPDKIIRLSGHKMEHDGQPWIRLSVTDHGTGIPPELRTRIFDPFFSTKPKDKGTGLGLSICHTLVKEHGGTLIVESAVGAYTRMILDLPARQE